MTFDKDPIYDERVVWTESLARRSNTTPFDKRQPLDLARSRLSDRLAILYPNFENARLRPHDSMVFAREMPFRTSSNGYFPEITRLVSPRPLTEGPDARDMVIIEALDTFADLVDQRPIDRSKVNSGDRSFLARLFKKREVSRNPYAMTAVTVPPNRSVDDGLLQRGHLKEWSERSLNPYGSSRETRMGPLVDISTRREIDGSEHQDLFGSFWHNRSFDTIWWYGFGDQLSPVTHPTQLIYSNKTPEITELQHIDPKQIVGQSVSISLVDGTVHLTTHFDGRYLINGQYVSLINPDWATYDYDSGRLINRQTNKPLSTSFPDLVSSITTKMEDVLKGTGLSW